MDTEQKKIFIGVGLPIAIALLALVVSFRSCSVSDEALQLSKAEFGASRALVLTSEFSEKNDEVIFKPLSDEMKLVTLKVHEPSQLLKDEVEFSLPFAFETEPPGTWKNLEARGLGDGY